MAVSDRSCAHAPAVGGAAVSAETDRQEHRYKATKRDEFAIWLANRVMRLLATRRCVELQREIYWRGLHPGLDFPEQPDYDWSDVFEEDEEQDERVTDPWLCNHCPHDERDHRGDGCLHCGCDVPQ